MFSGWWWEFPHQPLPFLQILCQRFQLSVKVLLLHSSTSLISTSLLTPVCVMSPKVQYLVTWSSTIATSIAHSKLDYCNLVSILQSIKFSDKSTSTNPKLSCSHCCRLSQVLTHHSCNQVSALAKGQGTYWVQVIGLQRFCLLYTSDAADE